LRIIIRGFLVLAFVSLLRLKKTSLQVLGERVRAARKAKRLSQEDLALLSNIDRSYIGGVERGERNLSFKKLCAISFVVGCDVGSLCSQLPLSQEKPRDLEAALAVVRRR
jgi:transcriptional regulator with XRE-family HTH domain